MSCIPARINSRENDIISIGLEFAAASFLTRYRAFTAVRLHCHAVMRLSGLMMGVVADHLLNG